MNRILACILFTFATIPLAMGQCAIRPIKPIPPIGCKDLTPQCVSDSNGESHWNWVCVRRDADEETKRNRAWESSTPRAAPQKRASENSVQTTPHNPVNAPFPEPASAIGVPVEEMDSGEQRATEQLRSIAETIKSCPPLELPPEAIDPLLAKEGFEDVYGPPLNVVWNVNVNTSTRARYEGSIEFSEPCYFKPPLDDAYCNKPRIDKKECRRRWMIVMRVYKQQADHPLQFRYEFDVTPHGLRFLRAFKKTDQTDEASWVAGGLDSNACARNAITSVLDRPSAQSEHAAGIPVEIWNSATSGDRDAQLLIGIMYEKGTLVPQNYAEAFFWLNLAASGQTKIMKQEDVTTIRDSVASHLTPTVLLQTQERARKWFEEHPAKANLQ